jgi:capsular exopolysaccharide synthesis family protein
MSPAVSSHRSIGFDPLDAVTRRWRLLLGWCVVTGCLVFIYWLVAPRTFESQVEMLVMEKDPALTSVRSFTASNGRADAVEDVLATHMRLFGSRQVIRNAIESHALAKLPGVQSHVTKRKPRFDKQALMEKYISDHLTVRRGGKGQAANAQVLHAAFRHSDAEETEKILSALVDSYQSFITATFAGVGTEAFELFAQSRDGLSDELKDAERKHAQFMEVAPIVFSRAGNVDLYEQILVELMEAKHKVESERATAASRLQMVKDATEGEGAAKFTDMDRLALIDESHVERLSLLVSVERGDAISEEFQATQPVRSAKASVEFDRLVAMQLNADQMKSKFGPRHPKFRNLANSIEELKRVVNQDAAAGLNGRQLRAADVVRSYRILLEHDLQHLDRQLEEIADRIQRTTNQVHQARLYGAGHRLLASDLERKQDLYGAVVARMPELAMTSKFGGYLLEVIAPVSIAEVAWPKLPQLGLLALVLGLCGGMAAISYAEFTRPEFHSAHEVQQLLGLPVLGLLDAIEPKRLPQTRSLEDQRAAATTTKDATVQAFRFLRNALPLASHETNGCYVMQFAGANPGVGTSVTAANAATAVASIGKRVLLVDADFHRPTQHRLTGMQPSCGLADVLNDSVQLSDALMKTGVANLDLLPAGNAPDASSELLSTPRFAELLDTLRDQYEYIFVDTPPILALVDSLSVATHADGVAVVVPTEHDALAAAQEAVTLLKTVQPGMIGAVINDRNRRLSIRNGNAYGGKF